MLRGGKICDKIWKFVIFFFGSLNSAGFTFLYPINRFIAIRASNPGIPPRVNWYTPSSESWKIPMIELFFAGLIIWYGTAASPLSSASASSSCGMCKFISSPSKSALYGLVSPIFMRNVSPCCMTRTMWHIILILWSVGWRLNKMPSPSIMWRCTTSPFSSTMVLRSIYLSEISPPVFFSRMFAPG